MTVRNNFSANTYLCNSHHYSVILLIIIINIIMSQRNTFYPWFVGPNNMPCANRLHPYWAWYLAPERYGLLVFWETTQQKMWKLQMNMGQNIDEFVAAINYVYLCKTDDKSSQ